MAKNAATHPSPASSPANRPADAGPALAPVIEINVRHVGRTPQPEKLTGSEAPEGWIKKIDRPREGKVWVGFFHLYVTDPSGTPVRKKKEKTLGPATMPKQRPTRSLPITSRSTRASSSTRENPSRILPSFGRRSHR